MRSGPSATGRRSLCRRKSCLRSFRAFRAAKFPDHLIPRMGAHRLYAPYLKEHGCAGVSYTAYGLIMQELERADSGVRSLASVQGGARNTSDPFIRLSGATCAVVVGISVRRARGLLWTNGTWTRLGPGWNGNSRQTRRRSLHFERQ
jgi:alkylation response protein AidB-like acyl-CoA dehydrogenase